MSTPTNPAGEAHDGPLRAWEGYESLALFGYLAGAFWYPLIQEPQEESKYLVENAHSPAKTSQIISISIACQYSAPFSPPTHSKGD